MNAQIVNSKNEFCYYTVVNLVVGLLTLLLFSSCKQASAPASKFLMFDSEIIAETQNAELLVHQVEKYAGNPLVRWTNHPSYANWDSDHPPTLTDLDVPEWEKRTSILYPNAKYDEEEGIYKLWYHVWVEDDWVDKIEPKDSMWKGMRIAEAYMTSEDGLHWTRPDLDVFTYEGEPTNLVNIGGNEIGILKDPNYQDESRKYKMVSRQRFPYYLEVSFSPDGIHWEKPVKIKDGEPFNLYGDAHNNALWVPELNKYVLFTRGYSEGPGTNRTMLRMESKDFLNWSDPVEIIRGTDTAQTYSMPVQQYADRYYIGLISVFRHGDGDQVHVELAWSTDTYHWQRINAGTPFIPNAEDSTGYDYGMIYPSSFIVKDDQIKIYYAGLPERHIPDTRTTTLNLATLESDRFAGFTPSKNDTPGFITTNPFEITGSDLKLTADIQDEGEIHVAVLDESGNPFEGFGFDDSEPITRGEVTDKEIHWSDKTLSDLTGSNIQLKFQLSNATLYSVSGNLKLASEKK
ncbi:hypothetical protein [Rhodohalobacter sp. 614A]|uniref:hypothetical protein n=1 Tax=Rhodohalobacter sp. 614A TaxID=2908649 RepID=UPI001F396174|nr:hypothetical protein [Rhodohalobacter sp. 614A]